MATIRLPFPPSVNHYWASRVAGGARKFVQTFIGTRGKEYRASVIAAVRTRWPDLRQPLKCRLSVKIDVYPPDRRTRDLSNLPKAVEDALTHAGVWVDDSQIDELLIVRKAVISPGHLELTIEKIEAEVVQGNLFEGAGS